MNLFKILPTRQKVLIGFTIITGLFLLASSLFNLVSSYTTNLLITLYSFAIPLFLLGFDTVADLNNNKIFLLWLCLGIIMFLISLANCHNEKFLIERGPDFDPATGINSVIISHATSSLKSLLIFLIVYWTINWQLNRIGRFVVNTGRQTNWYHAVAGRKITALDVIINLFLALVIVAAAIIDLW